MVWPFWPPPQSGGGEKAQTTYFPEISVYQTEKKFISLKEFISQRKPVYPYNIFFSWLIIFFSAKKKKYSPTNEVTHPTETPLYL